MKRCQITKDNKLAREGFKGCIEKVISTESSENKGNNIERKGEGKLSKVGFSKLKSILEDDNWRLSKKMPKMYSQFTFSPLQNFAPRISKPLRENVTSYLDSK